MYTFSASPKHAVELHGRCLYECRCRECQTISICGWCVYDHVCTASPSLCRHPNDWIREVNISGHGVKIVQLLRNRICIHLKLQFQIESLCPAVLPAIKGRYVFPVGVKGNFTLHTRHMPPPVSTLISCIVITW